MSNPYWQKISIWVLKADLVVWAINAVSYAILSLSGLSGATFGFFSKIALLETGISFLVGGALAFSGSVLPNKAKGQITRKDEDWSIEKLRSSERRANKYLVLAVILFVECLAASFLGF